MNIDKNIPIPGACRKSEAVGLCSQMEVGDSIFLPSNNGLSEAYRQVFASIMTAKYKPKKFIGRKAEGGRRIWRTE